MNAVATAPKKQSNKKPYRGPQQGVAPSQKGSKYKKKFKGNKPKPRVKHGEPVFLYYVQGTEIRATKVPCERNPEATKLRPSQSPLGTWRNPVTGKKCKVTRVRNVKQEVDENEPQT